MHPRAGVRSLSDTRYDEALREQHRPDWLAIFLGVTCTFAFLGASSVLAMALGMLDFGGYEPVWALVLKMLWGIASITAASYGGAFITGLLLDQRNRVVAAMDGLLVWELTVILFALVGWFGYEPLPAVSFSRSNPVTASEGIVWMVMMLGLPVPFAAAYGAMAGNARVRRKAEAEKARREAPRQAA